MPTLDELRAAADRLARDLAAEATLPCRRPARDAAGSCCVREAARGPTPAERRAGAAFGPHGRPPARYDPDQLCAACRAYWHAGQAAAALADVAVLTRVEAAEAALRG